jgi:subfamily B ATP-binding cassette protein MsbA
MLIAMLWLNWRFALLALSVTPVLFWTVYQSTHRVRAAAKAARQSDGLLASLTQETLASIRLVQGLAQEHQQDERFRKQGDSSLEAYLEGVRYQARLSPIVDLLAGLGLAIVMWYGATRVMARVITTGDLVIFFAYVTNLYSPMRALSRLSFSSSKARAASERICELLRAHRDVADPPHAKQCPRARGHIRFENVSFSYDGRTFILNDINLEIAPGERVAIVGATGAGKSSLVSLVPRFFDPGRGTVYIDGHDVRNYSVASYRENISLVLQETLLFRATVRENIAFGRPDATDEQIVAAANVAQADEFIRDLPEGYNTVLAERGVTLSGGQRQRIAIARAVLRDAPILILDEPTSGLDAHSEQLVVKALEQAAAGRTSLMITHRLASASFADRIIVLEQSRIVEEGTRQQLMSRGGRYAELVRLQLDDHSTQYVGVDFGRGMGVREG